MAFNLYDADLVLSSLCLPFLFGVPFFPFFLTVSSAVFPDYLHNDLIVLFLLFHLYFPVYLSFPSNRLFIPLTFSLFFPPYLQDLHSSIPPPYHPPRPLPPPLALPCSRSQDHDDVPQSLTRIWDSLGHFALSTPSLPQISPPPTPILEQHLFPGLGNLSL